MFANFIHLAHVGAELHAYICELIGKKLRKFLGPVFF